MFENHQKKSHFITLRAKQATLMSQQISAAPIFTPFSWVNLNEKELASLAMFSNETFWLNF